MLSDHWVRAVLRASVGHTALPAIAGTFFAACSREPPAAATGATIPELTYTGHHRVALAGADWEEGDSPNDLVNAVPIPLGVNVGEAQTMFGFAIVTAGPVGTGDLLFGGRSVGFIIHPSDPAPIIPAGVLHLQI